MERGEARNRILVGRPRWWAVLAVSLALMALVASLSAGARGAPGPAAGAEAHHPTLPAGRAGARDQSSAHTPAVTPRAGPAGTSTASAGTGAAPGGPAGQSGTASASPPDLVAGLEAGTSAVTVPTPAGGASGTAGTAAPPATTSTTRTTATTATTAPPTTTTAAAGTTQTEIGNLTYPDNVAAEYAVPGGGAVQVTATWSGTPDLTLSIACPARTARRSGASELSVSVPQPAPGNDATCTVAIAEPTGVEATVSYSLAVTTGGGS